MIAINPPGIKDVPIMFRIPMPASRAIRATPVAVTGKTNFTATLLRKLIERLLNQRALLDEFKLRRGDIFSHKAITRKTKEKLTSLIKLMLSIINAFIEGCVIFQKYKHNHCC